VYKPTSALVDENEKVKDIILNSPHTDVNKKTASNFVGKKTLT
jgi:hypothetical protein